jgi:hypothetical protein
MCSLAKVQSGIVQGKLCWHKACYQGTTTAAVCVGEQVVYGRYRHVLSTAVKHSRSASITA